MLGGKIKLCINFFYWFSSDRFSLRGYGRNIFCEVVISRKVFKLFFFNRCLNVFKAVLFIVLFK